MQCSTVGPVRGARGRIRLQTSPINIGETQEGTATATIGSFGQVDRALHGTGAGSAVQRVGLKGTSWREQDVPNSCRESDILIYQLKVVHIFVKFPTVIFHETWRFRRSMRNERRFTSNL
jgi:hypothetical protein